MISVFAVLFFLRSTVAINLRGESSQAPIGLAAGLATSDLAQAAAELRARDAEVASQWAMMKDEKSPWKIMAQGKDEHRNICIQGKQVPDFYVLGVQKCATSSLANNLMEAGMKNVHGDLNPKEFHWFDHRMNYSLPMPDGYETNKAQWLSWMPECPIDGMRSVLADFTPDYLRLVPRPHKDFTIRSSLREWMKVQEMDILGPQKMRNLYGPVPAQRLHFAVMFREPLAQMQSAWYHAKSFNFHNACKSCKASSFKEALQTNLEELKEQGKSDRILSPWVWTTMYARQLEPWLKFFNPSQFYLIPMKQLTGEKKDNICYELSSRLSFGVDCNSEGAESLHSWSHEHPQVDEDAGPEMRKAFDRAMAPEKWRLIKLLTNASRSGMGLANYEGQAGNATAIKGWLEGSW